MSFFLRPAKNTKNAFSRNFNIHTRSLVKELQYRGLLADLTASQDEFLQFLRKTRGIYCGIDPTASSLHIGNLLPLLTLLHFQVQGHHPIVLLGGATGLVGDPSGRDHERPTQAAENVRRNTIIIQDQIIRLFKSAHSYVEKRVPLLDILQPLRIIDNLDWWGGMTLVNFLQSTGKLARIGNMLSKESVKTRMESSSGISFAEFSYQLLQAHDFWHLYSTQSCNIQVGGSDQWGNIVAGLDLIGRRKAHCLHTSDSDGAFGITTPIITNSSGQKFGKSTGKALWLDPEKTSVFDFYQFFLRTPDLDVEQYLKQFTFLEEDKIEAMMLTHNAKPELRSAQRELANEVTELVHGETGVVQAQAATRLFFDVDIKDIRLQDAANALRCDPRYFAKANSELVGVSLAKLATLSGLTKSRAEAVRLIESHGLYLNNVPVGKKEQRLEREDLIGNQLVILRAGKDKHVVLAIK